MVPEKSHDLGSSFPAPNALIYSVSLVVSCLVSYAPRMIFTDDKKTMMMIFH
jgi:hypothetical protein